MSEQEEEWIGNQASEHCDRCGGPMTHDGIVVTCRDVQPRTTNFPLANRTIYWQHNCVWRVDLCGECSMRPLRDLVGIIEAARKNPQKIKGGP